MELVSLAVDIGLIHKGGSWYSISFLNDEKSKFQGTEKVRQFLIENPKVYNELYLEVKKTMGIQ
jgi:hypothetical protein